jgi:hypothetical protein
MMIKCTKLYDPMAHNSVSIITTMLLLDGATTLTYDFDRILPLAIVIQCTKLYGPQAYNSVSILPTMFFSIWCYNINH